MAILCRASVAAVGVGCGASGGICCAAAPSLVYIETRDSPRGLHMHGFGGLFYRFAHALAMAAMEVTMTAHTSSEIHAVDTLCAASSTEKPLRDF